LNGKLKSKITRTKQNKNVKRRDTHVEAETEARERQRE
jgi:hypothetical protein